MDDLPAGGPRPDRADKTASDRPNDGPGCRSDGRPDGPPDGRPEVIARGRPLPAPGRGGIERRRPGALEEFDPVQARRNRRWMALVLFPSLLVGAAALAAALLAGSSSPTVHPVSVPAGYQAISDGYFGYAVPKAWTQNSAYTDDVGDLDYSGQTGWAAEHVGVRAAAPTPGEPAPTSLQTFGEPRNTPYQLGAAQPISITGGVTALRYQMTRPGGFTATAVDAWIAKSGAEVWFVIHTDPATTATILASLKAA